MLTGPCPRNQPPTFTCSGMRMNLRVTPPGHARLLGSSLTASTRREQRGLQRSIRPVKKRMENCYSDERSFPAGNRVLIQVLHSATQAVFSFDELSCHAKGSSRHKISPNVWCPSRQHEGKPSTHRSIANHFSCETVMSVCLSSPALPLSTCFGQHTDSPSPSSRAYCWQLRGTSC